MKEELEGRLRDAKGESESLRTFLSESDVDCTLCTERKEEEMKFKPSGSWIVVKETREVIENEGYAYGEVIASNVDAYTYRDGVTVVYSKYDRNHFGLGFPDDHFVLRSEDVIGAIERDDGVEEETE